MSVLARQLLEIHDALTDAGLAHAFGGAIALAYCTEEPRGTRDLDVNVFVDPSRVDEVFAALPDDVSRSHADVETVQREGQVRVWWDDTPIDLFLNVHRFHDEVARSVRQVPFSERTIPVVGCRELAVFKALLNRTKDWADIEAMAEKGSIDAADAVLALEGIVGGQHPATKRMAGLSDT